MRLLRLYAFRRPYHHRGTGPKRVRAANLDAGKGPCSLSGRIELTEADVPHILLPRAPIDAIPIEPVAKADFPAWLKSQPDAVRRWITAT